MTLTMTTAQDDEPSVSKNLNLNIVMSEKKIESVLLNYTPPLDHILPTYKDGLLRHCCYCS